MKPITAAQREWLEHAVLPSGKIFVSRGTGRLPASLRRLIKRGLVTKPRFDGDWLHMHATEAGKRCLTVSLENRSK